MYIYTIIVLLEILEIVLSMSFLIFYFQSNTSYRTRNVLLVHFLFVNAVLHSLYLQIYFNKTLILV